MILFQPNLLPPAVRDETRYAVFSRAVVRLGVLSLALIVFFSVLLLPSYLLVNLERGEILRQVQAEEQHPLTKRVNAVDKTVQKTNQRLRRLKTTLSNQNTLSAVLAAILADTPPGIGFRHFIFDRSAKSLSLAGHAKTRQDILELDKHWRVLPVVSAVELPLENLVHETEIDFTIRILLKL